MGAEIARLEGRDSDAMRLYEQAIRSARDNGFVHNQAIADERASAFYQARGFDQFAETYLRNARLCYLRWGADAKVRELDRLHSHIAEPQSAATRTTSIDTPVERLDLATVIKVSQAVSGEIVLGNLVKTLLRIAIEHAGAERGLLILFKVDEPQIAAEATTARGQLAAPGITLRQTAVSPADLPESVLHYVIRTRESVIVADTLTQNPFPADEYICQKHARSILFLPLVKQAELIGVLYLENNLASHVFTPSRISVLELLASQARRFPLGRTPVCTMISRNGRPESAAWLTPISSGSSSSVGRVASSRPIMLSSRWWDTTERISSQAGCASPT